MPPRSRPCVCGNRRRIGRRAVSAEADDGGSLSRVWMSSLEDRDLQQLLWHRHRLVQMRTWVLNQLRAIAMNEGIQRNGGLRRAQGRKRLEQLPLGPWATRRREDLLLL